MKKKMLVSIGIFAVIFILMLTLFLSGKLTAGKTAKASVIPKYLKNYTSEEEYLFALRQEDFETLVEEIKAIDPSQPYSTLTYYAAVLQEKCADVSEETLRELYHSAGNAVYFKMLLLEIYGNGKRPILLDYDMLEEELLDSQTPPALQAGILDYLSHPQTYGESDQFLVTLGDLLNTAKDETLRSNTLKEIFYRDPETAIKTIDAYLEKYEGGALEGNIRTALSLKGESLKNGSEEEISGFLSLCDEILQKTSDVDAICAALLPIHTRDVLLYILNNEKIDSVMKGNFVYHNYEILSEIAKEPVTEETVRTITYAMQQTPLLEMEPDINTMIQSNADFFGQNTELLDLLNETLAFIKENGIHEWGIAS